GSIMIAEGGRVRILSRGWTSAWGLAWATAGREVWFTGEPAVGLGRRLNAVTLSGKLRTIERIPGNLTLEDLAPGDRALLGVWNVRFETVASSPVERNLTLLGFSFPRD